MRSDPVLVSAPSPFLGRLLAGLAIALVVVFLAAVLTAVLPPRLLDPPWQLQFTAVLINNAVLALVAAVLMTLAVWFNPGNTRLRARNLLFRRGAVAAALGFLLLAPLQGMAAWRLYRNVTLTQEQQTSQSSRQLAELRQAISSATTHQELQARVRKVVGTTPPLSQSELRTPLSVLQKQLLARVEQASDQLLQHLEVQAARKPDRLVKETIRIAVSSLAYAFAFALLAGLLPRRLGPTASLQHGVDDLYFEKLAE